MRIFALGGYIGEWYAADHESQTEINIGLHMPYRRIIWRRFGGYSAWTSGLNAV
jgi:hypothetical protein